MTMQPQEYKANSVLNERIRASRRQWIKDWGAGLAYCNECDKEYTDLEAIIFDELLHCPGCSKPENKTYYYCSMHGTSVCQECKD